MVLVVVLGVGVLLGASAASAADRVYFSSRPQLNFDAQGTIGFAGLDGSGGADLATTGASVPSPEGVALDPAHGLIYWADHNGRISFARLDGGGGGGDLNTTGAFVSSASGVAIDPVAGRIYWANGGNISFARLDGGGGGVLNTSGAADSGGTSVAVDPAAGLLYYTTDRNTISFARLDGSGGGDLNTTGATVSGPSGVALDPANGRIYWSNFFGNSASNVISFARLDGSGGGGDLNTTGAPAYQSSGVAVDPAAGRIYWAASNVIAYANLDGSGGGGLSTAGATRPSSGRRFRCCCAPRLVRACRRSPVRARSGRSWVALKGRGRLTWWPPLITTPRRALPIAGRGTSSRYRAGRQARSPPARPACISVRSPPATSPDRRCRPATRSRSTLPAAGRRHQSPPPSPVSPSPRGSGRAPGVSRLHVSPATFTAAGSGPSVIAPSQSLKPHHPAPGATVSYTLNAAATVRFTVLQRLPDREQRHGDTAHCVARPTATAGRTDAREPRRSGDSSRKPARGANRLRFSGRLNGHKLNPGTYTLVATPAASGKTGRAIKVTFQIIK